MSLARAKYRLTVDQYERMVEAGLFPEDAHIELVEGELLEMTPIGRRHAGVVNRLTRAFARAVADGRVLLSVQNPIRIDEHNEPQPDVALLLPRADDYATSTPTPREVLLLVEVADTTADYDRDWKARLYARASVVEYWVVDLRAEEVVVWRNPGGASGYQLRHVARRGEDLSPEQVAGVVVSVSDLLR